ncbi:CAAX prenyl protease 2 [Planococcus citri]|uniref:CAAX prenyl protease 2 n=1 Tax=Planococcus citri TaxID=170843 RepID=UPI0031F84753
MEECVIVIIQCLILSLLYVCSLYVWKYRYDRDHPSTIKRRFVSVTIVALISPIYLYFCLNQKYLSKNSLWDLLGLRIPGIWQATLYPLLLTVILFLGPIVFQIVNGSCAMYAEKEYWLSSFKDVVWIRTHVVAPVSEELTYRACMIPLLLQCFQPLLTIFVCPVFFGAAHFNHFLENLKAGVELKKSLAITAFQFFFTTIFGAYCTFLFLRTGHLVAPIVTHMFCNHMGFPDLLEPLSYSGFKRYVLFFTLILGFAIWCLLLMPITAPELYSNTLFWNYNYSQAEIN